MSYNKQRSVLIQLVSFVTVSLLTLTTVAAVKMTPNRLEGLIYKTPLHQGVYDTGITKPEKILGFSVGKRTATPDQIVELVSLWAQESELISIAEYARSHENRPLVYATITSPKNSAKLEQYKADLAKLADPRGLSKAQTDEIIKNLPGIAWMAYSIHGNETSGADGALAAIYELIASEDQEIKALLDDLVIFIDPSMNPDGRARFTKTMQETRQVTPNVDDQSLLHTGYWPYGRTNHYLFDLNRDFILGVHPETRGRVKLINTWRPQLVIDGHEMGSQDTFLFAPAREPINKNLSKRMKPWGITFAEDQASAFDDSGWPYYTGEWFENLYPGYSSYAEFRGSIHILYEQARMAEDGVRQGNDRILSYQESVHHQFASTLVNLKTLAKHSKDIYQDYVQDRRDILDADSDFADKTFVFLPSANKKRLNDFIGLLKMQGFELQQTTESMKFSKAINALGESQTVSLPKGTILLKNRQPEARLISAMLELDSKIADEVLVEERQRVLRDGSSLMYDTTAWNLAMMHGIEFYQINDEISRGVTDYNGPQRVSPLESIPTDTIAYITDGEDDASVAFAARLMEQGVQVRISNRKSAFNGQNYARGSVLVNRYDNEFYKGELETVVKDTAQLLSLRPSPLSTGFGQGELPELGGSHFELLEQPRIAILTRAGISSYDYGAIWHSIDTNLGVRHSHLDINLITAMDLRRYNTLVIPDSYWGALADGVLKMLDQWVTNGGSLIVVEGSVNQMVDPKNGISAVRKLEDVLDKTSDYDMAQMQEWLSQQESFPEVSQAKSRLVASDFSYPIATKELKLSKQQENYLAQFMPSGAFVAARTDQKHWLTYGLPKVVPLLIADIPVLMSGSESEAPVRLGYWKKTSDKTERSYSWFNAPKGYEMGLRMSGLLWPEAAQRLANAAYLTRETKGKGQIILFAGQPVFRGSTKVGNRLLLNALVYSSLGTERLIIP